MEAGCRLPCQHIGRRGGVRAHIFIRTPAVFARCTYLTVSVTPDPLRLPWAHLSLQRLWLYGHVRLHSSVPPPPPKKKQFETV